MKRTRGAEREQDAEERQRTDLFMNSNCQRAYRNRSLKLQLYGANYIGTDPSGQPSSWAMESQLPQPFWTEASSLQVGITLLGSLPQRAFRPPVEVSPNLIANALDEHTPPPR